MIPILNALQIDCACLGNHDLDFGLLEFHQLRDQCNFPWVCSNVRSVASNEPLGGCHEYVVLEKVHGVRLLVLGLIEFGWMETLSSIDPHDVEYEPFVDYVKRRVPEIVKAEGPFDMVIASSHMRMPNDYWLAEECGGSLIDIVLGGHDHHYEDSTHKGIHVINSGTDFGDFTIAKVQARDHITTTRVSITNDMEEDSDIAALVRSFSEQVQQDMHIVLGSTKVDLDARFSEIRTKETNVSNFFASVMARGNNADVVILNSGSIRADRIVPKGLFKLQDLCDLLPAADPVAVVAVSGEKLLAALENGVSQYPAMEGRFPCVDGVRFAFDPSQPPGSRVVQGSVYVRDRGSHINHSKLIGRRGQPQQPDVDCELDPHFSPLDRHKIYHVCSKTYLLSGKDGYDAFKGAKVVRDEELCLPLPTLVRNLFTEIAVMRHWAGITDPTQAAVTKAAVTFHRNLGWDAVVDPFAITPVVDGRITNILETV
jgi:5'-nucleotidase